MSDGCIHGYVAPAEGDECVICERDRLRGEARRLERDGTHLEIAFWQKAAHTAEAERDEALRRLVKVERKARSLHNKLTSLRDILAVWHDDLVDINALLDGDEKRGVARCYREARAALGLDGKAGSA